MAPNKAALRDSAIFWVTFGGAIAAVSSMVVQLGGNELATDPHYWPPTWTVAALVLTFLGGLSITWAVVLFIRRGRSLNPARAALAVRWSWVISAFLVLLMLRLVQTNGISDATLRFAQWGSSLTIGLTVGAVVLVITNAVWPHLAPPPGWPWRDAYPSSDVLYAIWEGEGIEATVDASDLENLVGTWTSPRLCSPSGRGFRRSGGPVYCCGDRQG